MTEASHEPDRKTLRQKITSEAVGAICNMLNAVPFFETLCFSSQILDELEDLDDMTTRDWRKEQRQVPLIGVFLKHASRGVCLARHMVPKERDADESGHCR